MMNRSPRKSSSSDRAFLLSLHSPISAYAQFILHVRRMLLLHSSPLTDRPQYLGQSLAQHLAPRLRAQAPLISIATFSPEPSTATQQNTWTQQLVRPGYSATAGAVSPPAVSSNVQVLRSGVRPGGRVPTERRYRRKPKLRVAVDVDEGEHFSELVPVVMRLWVVKA